LLAAAAFARRPPTRLTSPSTRRTPPCARGPTTTPSRFFRKAIDLAPERAAIRKDLGYTYIKVGENELAREQFRAAMEIDPADSQVAMEFAFLAYETKQQAEARRVFDRIRKLGGPSAATAEQAFQNIDAPLAAGIERWKNAIAMGGDNFSAHFELATWPSSAMNWRWPPNISRRHGASCRIADRCWSTSAACGKP
jgi:tetratricopeptide (TPR) repeat protein